MSKPRLQNVTVCIIDCAHPEKSLALLEHIRTQVEADRFLLITDQEIGTPTGIDHTRCEHLGSIEEVSRFMLNAYWSYIDTSHVLNMQVDGFIMNPNAWSDSFTQYDYIGATWIYYPYHTRPHMPRVCQDNSVGNGGFSLRSIDLMKAASRLSEHVPSKFQHPEDVLLCRGMGPILRMQGFKFAPEAVANLFSVEERPYQGQFGFHGKNTIAMQPNVFQGLVQA